MTLDQHHYYRGTLWPLAMKAKGWDKLPEWQQERLRRALTVEASQAVKGQPETDSTAKLTQDQITALFKLLLLYIDPVDLDHARDVANPDETQVKDGCKRLVWKINQCGFHRNYIQAIAKWYCRQEQVTKWEDLPAFRLRSLLITANKNRLKKGMPEQKQTRPKASGDQREYVLKPRREVAPAGSDNCPY